MNCKKLLAAFLSCLLSTTGAVAQEQSAAPSFSDGGLLRPIVQDVLQSSDLVDACAPVPGTKVELSCSLSGQTEDISLDLSDLLATLKSEEADAKAEILKFANSVLANANPQAVYPLRSLLLPLVRSRDFVERASDDDRLPREALFPIQGFPDLVGFTVLDDSSTVHLLKDPQQARLALGSFQDAFERSLENAPWLKEGNVKFRCGLEEDQSYCSLRSDGFFESSLIALPGFADWLRGHISEPSFIAIPARDEVLIVPLSNKAAVEDLQQRLKRLRPFAITHNLAYWSGGRGAGFQPVKSWSLRGGMLLAARLTIKFQDEETLVFSF